MLTLSSTDLPSTYAPGYGGTQSAISDTNTEGAGVEQAAISYTSSPVDASGSTTIPSYSGDSVVVSIPNVDSQEVDTLGNVQVGGVSYPEFEATPEAIGSVISTEIVTSGDTKTTTETTDTGVTITTTENITTGVTSLVITPPAQTFTFDARQQEATVYVADDPPVEGTPITYTATKSQGTSENDDYVIELPQLLRKWNINGDITLTRSFESSPSGSFTFSATLSDIDDICSDFKTGTPLVINEHGYSVSDFTYEGAMSSLETVDRIQVTVQLRGIHDDGLDNVVKLRTSKNDTTTSLSTLCGRAGLTYNGPSVTIKIPKEAPLRTGTTVQSELARSRVAGGYANYSRPDAIEIVEWGKTTVHRLSKRDILNVPTNPITVTYGGGTVKVDGVLLTETYENTELQIERSPEGSNGRKNVTRIIKGGSLAGDSIIVNGNLPVVQMDTAAACFDNGGVTSNIIFTTYINNTVVAEEERIYGYAFSTDQSCFVGTRTETINGQSETIRYPVYEPTYQLGTAQSTHATIVEERNVEYVHDSDGYLIQELNNIRKLVRHRPESQQEAITTQINATYYENDNLSAADEAQVKAFYSSLTSLYNTFFYSTMVETTDFSLGNLRDYYPDIQEPNEGDPEPKFVLGKARSHTVRFPSQDFLQNIRLYEQRVAGLVQSENLPQTFTGSTLRETEDTTIIYPFAGISEDAYEEGQDSFKVSRRIATAQGERLKNVAKDETEEFFLNRPSPPPLLQLFDEGNSGAPDEPESDRVTYLLRTPGTGLSNSDPSNGSISFPGADTAAKAIAAAKLDIAIRNTQIAEVWNVSVLPDRVYSEGDRVRLRGNQFVVLSVTERYQIQDRNTIKVESWGLSLGKLMALPVTVGKVDD